MALSLVKYINNDKFFKKNIVGITINDAVTLRPRYGNYIVELDDVVDFQEKLNRFKCFAQLKEDKLISGIYDKVNISFNNQLICTKLN